MARGNPSRRTQISAMVRVLAGVSWKSGLAAFAPRKMREVGERQRWDGKFVFTTDVQYSTAGHQDFELRAGGQQVRKPRYCWQHLLEVVQQQQQVLVLQRGLQKIR